MNIDLEYPLGIDKILRKKKSIKKELLNKKNLVAKNIAILGGSTTSEIRNILEYHDLKVLRLIRISFGPFKLNNLQKGEIIEINKNKYKKTLNILE